MTSLTPSQQAIIDAQLRGAILDRKGNIVWPDGKAPAPTEEQLAQQERDARVLEAEEQKAITKILQKAGFTVRSTSQYRAAKVSPGLPDLIVHHKTQPIFFFWETKRQKGGVMSEFQKDFAADCKRCHVRCYAGDRYELRRVLRDLGIKELV